MDLPECLPPPESLPDSHYRQIVSSAIDYAIITACERGCITSWNRGAERLTGWSGAQAVGRPLHLLYAPEDAAAGVVEKELETAAREGLALDERWHVRQDGRRFWGSGEVMPLLRDDGRPVGFVKILRDRTQDRQHALDLQFLARASEELAGIGDHTQTLDRIARLAVPDFADYCVVDLVDSAGGLRRGAAAHADPARQAQARLLQERYPLARDSGGGPAEVLATGRPLLVPRLSREALEQVIELPSQREALMSLGLVSCIVVPMAALGQTVGVISFATAESGRVYGPEDLSLAQDLGRRAAIAVQNARLVGALREADRAKDVFMATLAHELRNPLAPIWHGLSIIQRVPDDRARVEQVGAMIERQVGQLSRLVDDLLDASRIATGKLELKKEPTNLVQVISQAVEMSRPHIEEAHHQLVLSFTRESTDLMADPGRLAQVFANLLNNAAKYTRHGGRIEVCVETHPTELVVRVKDNGAGIAPEMLRRVFGLFTQAPQEDEHRKGGLGIGLSLVDGLVRLHGGHVEARSEGLGKGSEFIVHLPRLAREAAAAPAAPAPPEAEPAHAPRRVLVVDDNVDAATTVADLLSMTGSEVDVVHDGHSAVAHAASFKPDVVLLDIGLPDISGYEAARQIRKLQGVRQPKLIALTGWGQAQDKQMAAQAGFDQHWTKPVDPQKLLDLAAAQA